MYLLMLLATFLSSIYGYNLSARPDYDRDVARKKAQAIVYRFNFQHKAVIDSLWFIYGMRHDADGDGSTEPVNLTFPLPNTVFSADETACSADGNCGEKWERLALFFKDSSGDKIPIYLRNNDKITSQGNGGYVIGVASDVDDNPNASLVGFGIGRYLYSGQDMASQLLCLDNKLHEDGVSSCSNDDSQYKDEDGNLTGTCCRGAVWVLVSYKKVDPRWLNRLTNQISFDFWRALEDIDASNNIGLIFWDESEDRWMFRGKTGLYAAYKDDYEDWLAEEEQKKVDDSSYVVGSYAKYRKTRTSWLMPEIFDENLFKNINGVEMCKDTGCIFRINEL